jgi:uncharacterized protein involved in exopolysaccharide biosynthesis
MQMQETKVFYFFKGAFNYKWTILIITLVLCLCGWVFVSAMPDKYVSEVEVKVLNVDSNSFGSPCVTGPGFLRHSDCIQKLVLHVQQRMFTKENLERIIMLSELKKDIDTDNELQILLERLKKNIHITFGANEIFNISYADSNPVKARNVVQSILFTFYEQVRQTEEAVRFIDAQIMYYQAQLKQVRKLNPKRLNISPSSLHYDELISYDELINNRKELMLLLKDTLHFKSVTAPTVPLHPSSPNKILLLFSVFAGSLTISFATAILLFIRTNLLHY